MTSLRERFGALRMQTRLLLAFAAVAALPLTVVPLVIRAVNESYDRSFARALDDAAVTVERELARVGQEVSDRTRAASTGRLLGEVQRRLDEGDAAGLVALADPALAESGLDVLEVFERSGRILLSGHVPARFGDRDEAARTLLERAPWRPVLAPVEIRRGEEITQALAMVVAMPAEAPENVGLLGGRVFDDEDLARLGELVHGRVTLHRAGTTAAGPDGSARGWVQRLFGQARAVRDVKLTGTDRDRVLRIRLSDDALVQTKARIALGAIGAFLLAVLAGVGLAAILARGTVAPVEALVEGTRELAKGAWQHRVEVKARGEIGQLVEAFNQMASELSRARDRLAQAERVAAWEQIARALAHEIKNPLTPIAMAVETLQRTHERKHPEFDRFFREGTATVLEEVGRLKRLATEFGEFARWPKPVVSPAAPADLLRSAAALYSSLPEGVSLATELDEPLPEVKVDRDQMQRALVNLVKNGLEAMTSGGRMVLRARRAPGGVTIEVADSGPGLAAETRQKLFQPYFTTKVEGTGLGLAIVHRIVVEHHGRIEAVDTPGGGATFRIFLPAYEKPGATTPAA